MRAAIGLGLITSSMLAVAACSPAAAPAPGGGSDSSSPAADATPAAATPAAATPAAPAATVPAATAGTNCHNSYVGVSDPEATATGGPHWAFSQATADPSIIVLTANGNGATDFQNEQPQQPQQPSDPFGGAFGDLGGFFGFGSDPGQGQFPDQGQFQGATATVTDQRATPHTLILTANEPTQWQVTAVTPTAIQQIITLGDNVSVIGPPGVPVQHRAGTVATNFSADVDRDPAAAVLRNVVGQVHEIATADPFSTFTIAAAPTQRCATLTPEVPVGTPETWNTNGTPGFAAGNVLTAPNQGFSQQAFTFTGSTLRDHGKFYFEAQILISSRRQGTGLGISNLPDPNNPTADTDGCSFSPFGTAFCGFEPSHEVRSSAFTTGSRVGFAVDLDDGHLYMQANGVWSPSDPTLGPGYAIARGTPMTPVANLSAGDQIQMVFDAASLKTPAPAGYTAGW